MENKEYLISSSYQSSWENKRGEKNSIVGLEFNIKDKTLWYYSEAIANDGRGICIQKILLDTKTPEDITELVHMLVYKDRCLARQQRINVGSQSSCQYDPWNPQIYFIIPPEDQEKYRGLFDELELGKYLENFDEEMERISKQYKKYQKR